MEFKAPVEEQLFALTYFAGIRALADDPRFAEADAEMVDAIVRGIGALAEGEFAPLNRTGDRDGTPVVDGRVRMPAGFKEAWRAYSDGGWASLAAPREFGGQGLPFSLATVVLESVGAANMAFTLCPILTVGAVDAIYHHGNDDQKARYLPKLAGGEWTGTMNLTEPQAGSDVGALRTTATPLGDGTWSISGQKIFITFGDHDLTDNIVHLVLARTPGAPDGSRGVSLFLVPKFRLNADGTPGEENGIETVAVEHKLGINASPTCVLNYGGKGPSIGTLIGPENGGLKAMFTMMNSARLNVGLQGVQIAERACQQARAYAMERIQSPRAGSASKDPVAIIEHPDVRRMLFRMQASTDAIRALLYFAAGQADRASLGIQGAQAMVDLLTPMAKAYATDMGVEIASLGIQIHGGAGFIEATGAAQHLRDSRIAPIYEGTNGIQAADLVNRKLPMENGDVARTLLAQIAADASAEPHLAELAKTCATLTDWLLTEASLDDRLAGSVPFCNMLATAICGWLMVKQADAVREQGDDFERRRFAFARFYLDQLVPEALGLKAAVTAGSAPLYALPSDLLGA